MEITRAVVERLRDVVDAGLVHGQGKPVPGQMCVEAAVCYAFGLPHGDDPGCVSQPLRRLKIRLNDSRWSSNAGRAAGLRRLAVAQLGSAGVLDDRDFVRRVVDMTIRKAVPAGLRAAARVNPKHAGALELAAAKCEADPRYEFDMRWYYTAFDDSFCEVCVAGAVIAQTLCRGKIVDNNVAEAFVRGRLDICAIDNMRRGEALYALQWLRYSHRCKARVGRSKGQTYKGAVSNIKACIAEYRRIGINERTKP